MCLRFYMVNEKGVWDFLNFFKGERCHNSSLLYWALRGFSEHLNKCGRKIHLTRPWWFQKTPYDLSINQSNSFNWHKVSEMVFKWLSWSWVYKPLLFVERYMYYYLFKGSILVKHDSKIKPVFPSFFYSH